MTQEEKLIALLREMGVKYQVHLVDGRACLTIEGGYPHVYTRIDFDDHGQFLKWGSYE